jgi:hypothetical protein
LSNAISEAPSEGSSAAAAMASSSVDLPDPFSPTKSVTGTFTSSLGSVAIAFTQNGNAFASEEVIVRFNPTSRR